MKLRVGGESLLFPPAAFSPLLTARPAQRRLKRLASALVAVVTVAALSGCGASGTPLKTVNNAVRKTLASTWVRYELSLWGARSAGRGSTGAAVPAGVLAEADELREILRQIHISG
jgi:hypothetical protein